MICTLHIVYSIQLAFPSIRFLFSHSLCVLHILFVQKCAYPSICRYIFDVCVYSESEITYSRGIAVPRTKIHAFKSHLDLWAPKFGQYMRAQNGSRCLISSLHASIWRSSYWKSVSIIGNIRYTEPPWQTTLLFVDTIFFLVGKKKNTANRICRGFCQKKCNWIEKCILFLQKTNGKTCTKTLYNLYEHWTPET